MTTTTLLFALLSPLALSSSQAGSAQEDGWNAAAAEHLLNRAGFGGNGAEIGRVLATGTEAWVEHALSRPATPLEPYYADWLKPEGQRDMFQDMGREERRQMANKLRVQDRLQLRDFTAWWIDRMVAGEDPLRERMTLFWHGFFTSSMDDVKNSFELIAQNEFLRANAFGNFGDLVHGIARDPAMLEYLDNDVNRKGKPNENFARELMELFTLGEGNYTEDDIKEAARAFTGWTDRTGKFRFNKRQHDGGEKTVLGVTGTLDGDDVIEVLLDQPACARFLAGKLLTYFEGRTPGEGRLETYATVLRSSNYDIAGFLRTLLTDPAFYGEDVIGARIAGPVDYMVGSCRRLGVHPPAAFLITGSMLLGQKLFYPPNVKGWEGGQSWITTSTLMTRGNLAGLLLGVVNTDDLMTPPDLPLDGGLVDGDMGGEMDMDEKAVPASDRKGDRVAGRQARDGKKPKQKLGDLKQLKALKNLGYRPRINLSVRLSRMGAENDGDLVDLLAAELLARELSQDTRKQLVANFRSMRREAGFDKKRIQANPIVLEPMLRDLAHQILSLPEAQLN